MVVAGVFLWLVGADVGWQVGSAGLEELADDVDFFVPFGGFDVGVEGFANVSFDGFGFKSVGDSVEDASES